MSLDTYDGLQASVASYLDDDSLSDQIQDFIRLAEARLSREIRIREMLMREDLAILEDDRYVNLPDDFLDHKYLRIQTPAGHRRRYFPDLDEVNIDKMTQESVNEKRRPCIYTIHEQIEFDSEADQDYTAEIFYYVELTPLSDSVASNVLLARDPSVYLYASLLESAPFLLNDERLKTWGDMYVDAKDKLNRSAWESRRGGPLISKVRGATP